MNGKYALSVVVVGLGALILTADRVVGVGPFSFSSGARLAIAPTVAASATSTMAAADPTATLIVVAIPESTPTMAGSPTLIPTPRIPPTNTPVKPDPTALAQREARVRASEQVHAVSADEVWTDLAGFSGKTNQERERFVAENLFPKAGIEEIDRQGVPYSGSWGPEYGNWDGLSNVVARRRGSLPLESRKLIILGAHFDKVTYPGRSARSGRSDGIFDNASGVNVVAKIFQAIQKPFNDIEVVAFASEEPEPYFLGSRLYFGRLPNEGRVLFFANFDCLGIGNLSMVRGAAEPLLSDLAVRVADTQGIPLAWRASDKEVVSDHVVAQYFGLKVLYFTSESYDWHRTHVPEDNLSAIDREAYYRQYLLSLKIISYLDAYLAETSLRP